MTGESRTQLAIFLPSLSGGGAERAMLNLAQGLAMRDCDVDLVLAQAKGPYLKEVQEPLHLVDLGAPRALASLPALVRYLRRKRPDALLSALDYANVLAIWARQLAGISCRVAVNEQNTISRSARNSARWRQRLVPHLVRRFHPLADVVIGNSEGVVEDLSQLTGLANGRIKLLYNPVITPRLRTKARAPLNHPWFTSGQPPVILAVGRLTAQKDFPTLLEAFAAVRQAHAARLLILGDGPARAALEAQVEGLGLGEDVALPGFVENPYAYMSRASLFVLSSRWEGLPTVLIEALYCGPPIIATDCPSGPSEILGDGRHGLLVPVGDVSALTWAIRAGLTGLIPRPSKQSWHPYSVEVVADQYLDILTDGQASNHGDGAPLPVPATTHSEEIP